MVIIFTRYVYLLCCQATKETGQILLDWDSINSRIQQLDALQKGTKYHRQKCSLQIQLESFLGCLSPPRTIYDCTPEHVRYFLVWKDSQGRTKVHKMGCPFRGSQQKSDCGCPIYMAAGTMDSLIGKIRAIFRDLGKGSDWNGVDGTGNPAAAPLIKLHLKTIRREQAEALVVPRQATPLLFDKTIKLARFLTYKLKTHDGSLTTKYLLLRDRAYFILISQLGDRAGDLGLVQSTQVRLSSDKVVVEETVGKCLSGSKGKPCKQTILFAMEDALICPVTAVKAYFEGAEACGVDLKTGYMFRVLDKKISPQEVSDKPATSGAMNERLKTHLICTGMWDNETSHSARVGCGITLALLGVSTEGIKAHIGWQSSSMVEHYTRGAKAVQQSRTALTLAKAADKGPNDNQRITDVAKEFKESLQY